MSYIHSVRTMFVERKENVKCFIFQRLLQAFQFVGQTQEIKVLLY